MTNKRIELYIDPEDIYRQLSSQDKEQYKAIEIIDTFLHNGGVIIKCLVLENEVSKNKNVPLQKLFSEDNLIVN